MNIRTLADEANKNNNEQRIQMEKMGVKDELEIILKKAFQTYDSDMTGFLGYDQVKRLFNDARDELNADLIDDED